MKGGSAAEPTNGTRSAAGAGSGVEFATVLDRRRFADAMNSLGRTRDPELVLLKGHMLVERLLVTAAARRLRGADEELPRLSFAHLVDLAFTNRDERKRLVWLNELRNLIAHEFDAIDTDAFAKILDRFGVPWPDGSLERSIVIEWVIRDAIAMIEIKIVAHMREEIEATSPDPFQDMDEVEALETALDGANHWLRAMFDKMRSREWDHLIAELRPRWRDTKPGSG